MSYNENYIKKIINKYANFDINKMQANDKNTILFKTLYGLESKMNSSFNNMKSMINNITNNDMTASTIEYSNTISNMVTNVFTSTKVNVNVYISNNINAFTIPGSVNKPILLLRLLSIINSNNIYMRIIMMNIFKYTYLISCYAISFVSIIEKIMYSRNLNNKRFNIDYVSINNGKLTINIPEVTIFISSGLLKICETDREIIAIVLHEIGHNINVYYDIIEEVINSSMNLTIILSFIHNIERINDYNNPLLTILVIALYFCISNITFCIVTKYINKRIELSCDEFAIKCGYGQDLYNVISRVSNIYDYITKIYNNNKLNNIITSIINLKNYILDKMMSVIDIIPQEYNSNRLEIIKNKIDNASLIR